MDLIVFNIASVLAIGAIIAMFVVAHMLGEMNVYMNMALCWVVFVIILGLVTKFASIKEKG